MAEVDAATHDIDARSPGSAAYPFCSRKWMRPSSRRYGRTNVQRAAWAARIAAVRGVGSPTLRIVPVLIAVIVKAGNDGSVENISGGGDAHHGC